MSFFFHLSSLIYNLLIPLINLLSFSYYTNSSAVPNLHLFTVLFIYLSSLSLTVLIIPFFLSPSYISPIHSIKLFIYSSITTSYILSLSPFWYYYISKTALLCFVFVSLPSPSTLPLFTFHKPLCLSSFSISIPSRGVLTSITSHSSAH